MSQTVDRALSLLRLLSEKHLSLSEMAAEVGVHKSTVLRILQLLETQGFVRHDEHIYRLGPELFRLGAQALGRIDIRSVAAPHLRHLADQTGQTVHLGAFDGTEVFYIDKHEARAAVQMYSRIGASAPFHCTGVAKAILSALPINEQTQIVKNITFSRHTQRTITTTEGLTEELLRSAKRGYAVDEREHEEYIHCVAVPLALWEERPQHAISVSAATVSMEWDELLKQVPLLHQTAMAIRADII